MMMKRLAAAAIAATLAGSALSQDLLGGKTAQEVLEAEIAEVGDLGVFQEPALNIGDMAPALAISDWSAGEPISDFQEGTVYVVDFWATWCGPCIRSMPHLTELQEQHEADGLRVLAVNIWERMEGDERVEHVTSFVENKSDIIGYTVGINTDRSMEKTWMEAAGQQGIPTAMIVDREGRMAWIGYGTDPSFDGAVQDVLEGNIDYDAARAERLEAMRKEFAEQSGRRWYQHVSGIAKNGDMDRAAMVSEALFQTELQDSPMMLNAIAWGMVEDDGWPHSAHDLANRMATRACELSEWEDAAILDTLAWAQYRLGDYEAAVQTERKAIDSLSAEEAEQFGADFEKALEKFQKAASGG